MALNAVRFQMISLRPSSITLASQTFLVAYYIESLVIDKLTFSYFECSLYGFNRLFYWTCYRNSFLILVKCCHERKEPYPLKILKFRRLHLVERQLSLLIKSHPSRLTVIGKFNVPHSFYTLSLLSDIL